MKYLNKTIDRNRFKEKNVLRKLSLFDLFTSKKNRKNIYIYRLIFCYLYLLEC